MFMCIQVKAAVVCHWWAYRPENNVTRDGQQTGELEKKLVRLAPSRAIMSTVKGMPWFFINVRSWSSVRSTMKLGRFRSPLPGQQRSVQRHSTQSQLPWRKIMVSQSSAARPPSCDCGLFMQALQNYQFIILKAQGFSTISPTPNLPALNPFKCIVSTACTMGN